ncbi:2-hydroxyacid dehydrogenase [Hydrogenophaga sp. BPS33]|uniref:2-hydroxyacid dehydrogenase n=1 Tax=Hydrogenophaga sp. BPS33 TaxID=2651974 RepID=UPI00131FCFB9|nr:D-glycerate dehydrogenase [Hydrogenophaga sp. BPS33]QHE86469.1 D-glycerate dehydrogenase [Hydrogenophaga sp. BPS33]
MNTAPTRPRLLIARAIFPEVIDRLTPFFDVDSNQADDVLSATQMATRLVDKQGLLCTASDVIDAPLLAQCHALRICANMAVGFGNLDLAALSARGVVATHTPGVLSDTTADFGFALLMAAARRTGEAERCVREGRWHKWSYDFMAGQDVHGSTLGILGMGRIGQGVARRGAHGFGMRVIYHNRNRLDAAGEASIPARFVDMDTLLRESDHLVLTVAHSAATHHVIDAQALARMKRTATLVNIARGGVVDEDALIEALCNGVIAAAALDVFENEPAVHPALVSLPNVVLTPHMASASRATRLRMAHLAADNLLAYFQTGRALTPVPPLSPSLPA